MFLNGFFPQVTAREIGFFASPFQYSVAIANFIIGFLALRSFTQNYFFRYATVMASTIWLWGNAFGELHRLSLNHRLGIMHINSWLWMDIVIPFILIFCLRKLRVAGELAHTP